MSLHCFALLIRRPARVDLKPFRSRRGRGWFRGYFTQMGSGMFAGYLLLWSGSPYGMAGNTCTAPNAAAPCRTPASLNQNSPEPQLNPGGGNPVHLATGNKYQRETDLQPAAAWPWLALTRHYSAQNQRAAFMGPGWLTDFDVQLKLTGGHALIHMADGSALRLRALGQGHYAASGHGTLRAIGRGWRWQWGNGRQLTFDAQGRLTRVDEPAGPALLIERHETSGPQSGAIKTVTARGIGKESAARSGTLTPGLADTVTSRLVFSYSLVAGRAYVQHIDSPAGRFSYDYETATADGEQRLTAMQRPDGSRRVYLYEAEHQAGHPYALTGIENIGPPPGGRRTRQNQWVYNAFNQVVRFGLGAEQYTVSYMASPRSTCLSSTGAAGLRRTEAERMKHAPGALRRTRLQRADGVITDIDLTLRQGRAFVAAVTGAPCPGCPAPGTRADYDAQGRLTAINGSQIGRDEQGRLQTLVLAHTGWAGLTLNYDTQGRRFAWQSRLTGREHLHFNARGLMAQRHFADGNVWQYDYDDAGRPTRILQGGTETQLQWRGARLLAVQHPHESETRHYDAEGRMTQRTLKRPESKAMAESFAYDKQNRLIRHTLAEGGELHYTWGQGHQLLALVWKDAKGQRHTVIEPRSQAVRAPDRDGRAGNRGRGAVPGYRYGNGLMLVTVKQPRSLWWLLAPDATRNANNPAPPDHTPNFTPRGQRYVFDGHGRVQEEQVFHAQGGLESWIYTYDRHSRMIGAGQGRQMHWYAYDDNGASLDPSHPVIERNASGLPVRDGPHRLTYGANRRLTAVQEDDSRWVRYKHNAFGQRIRRHTATEHTRYWYLDRRLVAELTDKVTPTDSAPGSAQRNPGTPHLSRRYLYANHVPVGFIDYTPSHPEGLLHFVHADLTGYARYVTDQTGRVIWEARYQPYGQAQTTGIDFHLRGPGQYADPLTGHVDNLLRTYDPQRGQFLEPDPLGPVPGNQALGMANQQPRRFVDPLGLLLFAFDGTRNDASTQTNIWKLAQRYREGQVFYQGGPGNPHSTDWDAITAYSAPRILDRQWQALLDTLAQTPATPAQAIPIDIIGYSRGAALARHFGNQINQFISNGQFAYHDLQRGMVTACVDLRFMGIFDTVAQFGLNGANNAAYDLTVDAGWQWVAHAIALHERRWLFPLASAADAQPGNLVEAPFIGAHADIGGGVLYDDQGEPNRRGDLSDISLNWMLWQARAAGVEFGDGPAQDEQVSAPYLHDDRDSTLRALQNGDRRLDKADGSLWHTYQDDHSRLGRSTREITEAFIARYDDWRRQPGNEVGTVDMDAYSQWLEQTLGTTVPGDSSYH